MLFTPNATAAFDNPPITDIGNPSFGQITNTVRTPKLVPFSLRYASWGCG
ncbi:MAG: hypothetical protein ABSG40_02270 [Terriglobales bacterium]